MREILYVLNGKNLFYVIAGLKKEDTGSFWPSFTGQSEERPQGDKAVTYHGLQVAREKSGWVARVIFDV